MTQQRNLFTKIKLEILGADLVIEDADISIELKKTDEKRNNYCEITIYNLSDDTYNLINEKTNSVRVYTDTDGFGYALLFQGDLRDLVKHKKAIKSANKKTKKGKKKKATTVHYNEPSIFRNADDSDVSTVITLQDGIQQYFLNNYISKSYSGKVTNKYILQDIIKYVKNTGNVEISANIDELDEFTYTNGKVIQGDLKSVLSSLSKTGNCDCKINNNIVLIQKKNIQGSNFGYILNADICPKPEPGTDKEIDILAPFLPTINPLDFVRLDFKDYDGVYKVKSILTKVDNFGQDYETKVTVVY